jgi:hypothetical protein
MNKLDNDKTIENLDARVDVVKTYLRGVMHDNMNSTDSSAISIALLEMATDQFVATYGEQTTRHFIETSIRKSLSKGAKKTESDNAHSEFMTPALPHTSSPPFASVGK